MAQGLAHTLALGSDDNVYGRGWNQYGALGDYTHGYHVGFRPSAPVKMRGLPGDVKPVFVTTGHYHSIVITSDGKVYACGRNQDGQLGDGTTNERDPSVDNLVEMKGLPPGVSAVFASAGYSHTVVLGSDGNVYACGGNEFGQLGDGTRTNQSTLVRMKGLPPGVTVVSISASYGHTIILGSDGKAYACGRNSYGQLGNDTEEPNDVLGEMYLPAKVRAVAVSTGEDHTVVWASDGKIYSCGDNTYGQLGDATMKRRSRLAPMMDAFGEPFEWGVPKEIDEEFVSSDAVDSESSALFDVVSPPSQGLSVSVSNAESELKKQTERRETLAALIKYVDLQRESIQIAAQKRAQAAWFEDPSQPIEQWAVEAAMDLVHEESDVRKKYLTKEFPEMLEEAAILQADTLSVANFQEWAEKLFRTRRDH